VAGQKEWTHCWPESLELHLDMPNKDVVDDDNDDQGPDWTQALQTLSGIPAVQLRLVWGGNIADLNHPCIAVWVKQHGQLSTTLR
jgi:hypothetical protein